MRVKTSSVHSPSPVEVKKDVQNLEQAHEASDTFEAYQGSQSVAETERPAVQNQAGDRSVASLLLGRTKDVHAHYVGKSLEITEAEREALDNEDLNAFWNARLGKDPMARIGLGIWGEREQLKAGVSELPRSYWTPKMNLLSRLAVSFQKPASVSSNPQTKQELTDYWLWVGQDAKQHVERFLEKQGMITDRDDPKAQTAALMKKVGLALARAHVEMVDRDVEEQLGDIPGLLSRKQIATYHHAVLEGVGLPPEAYGGTPFSWLPDALELWVAGGVYAHDADTND